MRIDYFVKESYPKVERLEETTALSHDSFAEGYVVVFRDGEFAGISASAANDAITEPMRHPQARLGESVDAVLERMQKSRRPALPVFKEERFVGIVTQNSLVQYKETLDKEQGSSALLAENHALRSQVSMLQAELSELKAWTERANQARGVSCSLMRSSLSSLSLNEQLGEALDMIFSVPWLSVQSRGSIFLADDNGVLHLTVHRGLSDYLLKSCKTIQPGFCLCGRAAQTKKPVLPAP